MNHGQVIVVIMEMLNEEYPGKFVISRKRKKIWEEILTGIHPEHILTATYHFVSTNQTGWPPDVGKMRATAIRFSFGEVHPPSAADAWEQVSKVISGELEPATLPDLERQALRQIGQLYNLKQSANPAADRAQFIKAFEKNVERRDLERATMPRVKIAVEECRPLFDVPADPDSPPPPVEPVDKAEIAEFNRELAERLEEELESSGEGLS